MKYKQGLHSRYADQFFLKNPQSNHPVGWNIKAKCKNVMMPNIWMREKEGTNGIVICFIVDFICLSQILLLTGHTKLGKLVGEVLGSAAGVALWDKPFQLCWESPQLCSQMLGTTFAPKLLESFLNCQLRFLAIYKVGCFLLTTINVSSLSISTPLSAQRCWWRSAPSQEWWWSEQRGFVSETCPCYRWATQISHLMRFPEQQRKYATDGPKWEFVMVVFFLFFRKQTLWYFYAYHLGL